MADLPSKVPDVLGNTSLTQFDAIIIGSGAGGSTAARTLALVGGKKVLVLEHGQNYFKGLDDPAPGMPVPLFGNDEIKFAVRNLINQDPFLEPRTLRASSSETAMAHPDVNTLPKTVGGAAVHADMKFPRFNAVDFHLASELAAKGRSFPGTNFADWPVSYEELEPFYEEMERLSGVAGNRGADPFASSIAKDYPMPAGASMYVGLLLSDAARSKGYHPFPYPSAQNSRPYRGRPVCISCGFCSGFGCPNNSKSSPAVTTLREALLSGNCQLRYNAHVTRLRRQGTRIVGVDYIDAAGNTQAAVADHYILSASAIESARLALVSEVGNSSDMVGRNLMFHSQNLAIGIYKQRLHGERGRSVTEGMSDFRGVKAGGTEIDPDVPLGGIIEFGTNSEAISAAKNNLQALGFAKTQGINLSLKQLLVDGPFLSRIAVMIQQAEDAPSVNNAIDLDSQVRDVFGQPVPRITYSVGTFETTARSFYTPKMLDIHKVAGAQFGFVAPPDDPSTSRHVMGTLRMGADARTSVCDAFGKFHDLDNLYSMDGGVFVTSSGYNPTLTIETLALRAAAKIVSPSSPERVLGLDGPLA